MNIFKLPDLGEGLPDAEINEWHVKVGDTITTDAPLVSMETAKAVVDVPSPMDGVIAKLFGEPGDVIDTGAPLVEFVSDAPAKEADSGTVVGNIESSGETLQEDFIIGSAGAQSSGKRNKATPAVRALARKLKININDIKAANANGLVTAEEVKAHANPLGEDYTPLKGVRRAMVTSMSQSHQEVVPVTIFDDADIHQWQGKPDITARLVQAIVSACEKEPALNAWYDTHHAACKYHQQVNLGIAMDNKDGLFVPVIENAGSLRPEALREKINYFKEAVKTREIPPQELRGATITLSNFGNFAGRYASPIIVPPMVAILAVGRLRDAVVAHEGEAAVHRVIPLSLSFDHRAVTGGEATRFLGHVIAALQEA